LFFSALSALNLSEGGTLIELDPISANIIRYINLMVYYFFIS